MGNGRVLRAAYCCSVVMGLPRGPVGLRLNNRKRKESNVLVLHRKTGEAIVVGGFTIRVGRVDGNGVRLVVDAPRDVPVHREEIARKIALESGDKTDDLAR